MVKQETHIRFRVQIPMPANLTEVFRDFPNLIWRMMGWGFHYYDPYLSLSLPYLISININSFFHRHIQTYWFPFRPNPSDLSLWKHPSHSTLLQDLSMGGKEAVGRNPENKGSGKRSPAYESGIKVECNYGFDVGTDRTWLYMNGESEHTISISLQILRLYS